MIKSVLLGLLLLVVLVQGQLLLGNLDSADRTSASGWACIRNDQNQLVKVTLLVDDMPVVEAIPDQVREDVSQQCGFPFAGFSVTWSQNIVDILNSGEHTVIARAEAAGQSGVLPGSPKIIT